MELTGSAHEVAELLVTSQPSYALLADGSTVEIRHARPEDAADVRQMHEDLSPANAYFRFFSFSPQAPDREAQRLCRPEDADHAALLARLDGGLVGAASYEPATQAGIAEIAFAVSDEMHGRGIATLLLEHLVSIARQRRLAAFAAETLPENVAMQRVFTDAGLPVERHYADGVIELMMPLPGHEGGQLDHYLDAVAGRASRAEVASLRHLLLPESVAVIGAGRRRGSVGREILHNIVAGGFAGPVYPVNPRGHSMEGLTCLASAPDLPFGVDLAVIAVPPSQVPSAAAACGQRGVHAIIVITASLGGGGADLLSICRRYGMRLVGPNCFGIASTAAHLNATFAVDNPAPGSAGLVMQSGGVGIALLEHLHRLGIGVTTFASVGDKYDVSSNDMLTWWEQDEQTRLAVLYVESFGNPRGFARTARRVGRKLPVLTVIGGRSAAGQRAAASHTAASATPLVTQEALFGQAGIIATHSLGELIEAAAFLSCQELPAGRQVAIVSNAGGVGVLAADACGDAGLSVATLNPVTQRRLSRLLPPGAAVAGPVDTSATVGVRAFRACLEVVAGDEGVDAVLAVGVPTAVADLSAAILTAKMAKPLVATLLDQPAAVTLLTSGVDPTGPNAGEPGTQGRIPVYAYPESAAKALAHAVRYREWRDSQLGHVPDLDSVNLASAQALISAYLTASPGGGWLPEAGASALLASYGIAMIVTRVASSVEEALTAAAELGGNVVLKAEAAGVVHKTDAGAVKLDLRTEAEIADAYAELTTAFGANLHRVLVQPMLAGGVETIVGVVQEPVFGPLVVFGLGGVATEVLNDRAARLAPLTDTDATEMILGVRATPLLLGHRGSAAVDTAALSDLLLRVSRLADDLSEVAELDLNPVIARPDGAHVVDVRIRITPAAPRDPFLRQLR
ncbi:MAG TPA: bifunctional GNAT family N-acetyltransferase/acetate--CoA ligase family protein [Streptosporangiaceae bacterium]|nr:bifunctional GNAT family N-acetyltransferase/acetate--CoA ligase family protein [Streptosporangiaceae bacterium]